MKTMMKLAVVAAAWSAAALADMPKVLLMVDEKNLGSVATSEIETLAVEMLQEKGIETVDRNMLENNLERVQKAFRGAGDNRAAAAMAREFGADVILLGEAVAKPNAAKVGESNLRSYQAAVTLRAVKTDNAVNIATSSANARAVALDDVEGGTKALQEAGRKAIAAIIPKLAGKADAAAGPRNIELTVGGMDQIWKLKETRQRLKGMKDCVAAVAQKSYAQGAAVFRVSSLLPAEELAEELVMNPPEDLKVQIVEIRENAISARVVDAPQEDE